VLGGRFAVLVVFLFACSEESSSSPPRGSSTSGSGGTSGSSGDPGAGNDAGETVDGGGSGGSSSGSPSTGATGTCKTQGQAHKTGLTSLTHANGLKYSVYAPSTYDKNVGHSVVVLMHGQDSDGVPELNALWKPIADADQLVLIAPRGSRPSTNGNANVGNWATADLELVLEVMTDVDGCYNVFTKKHLLWGFSAGTFYGYLLGIAAAERFSGLAMGGANTSFARQNGYAPADATWKIPVSHVHGKTDFNAISLTYQDRDDFVAAGHVFTLHEHDGGHTISPAQVKMQWDDLKASSSP
jgi:poly(3-hydroxybutyrate) depolymerase